MSKFKNFFTSKLLYILILTLVLGFVSTPASLKGDLPDWTKPQVKLGLDLQGGTELDYRIDLSQVPEEDIKDTIDGNLEVVERRVNGLGVSESNIYVSEIANEKHIIVELPGLEDIEEAKDIIGKTVRLEFKEEAPDQVDEEFRQQVELEGDRLLTITLAEPDRFKEIGELESKENENFIIDYQELDFLFAETLEPAIAEIIFESETKPEPGTIIESKVEADFFGRESLNLIKVNEYRENERRIQEDREVFVSQILIRHNESARATDEEKETLRSKEEASEKASSIQQRLSAGEDFNALAEEFNEDPAGSELNIPTTENNTILAQAFNDAGFALTEVGQITEVVETEFGFHIIRADEINEAVDETRTEEQVSIEKIAISLQPNPWIDTELTGKYFANAAVAFDPQSGSPYVQVQFKDGGEDLFDEITARNVGKQIAIFVGGDLISAPVVNERISGGVAQISNPAFTVQSASDLVRDLKTGAIPADLELAGEFKIGASLGEQALNISIWAGIIGLIVLGIYMLFYYRLLGVYANIALAIYTIILLAGIKLALPTWLALSISFIIFLVISAKVVKSKESAGEKIVGLIIATFILFFLAFAISNPIVMTLAGVAGIILSIGMAVDANILIFERIKEEIKAKRPLGSAIQIGFNRAWPSIRDSNFSSLITCAILLTFGSSIIKAFAFNLALGILISMFSAITITRVLVGTSFKLNLTNPALFGVKVDKKEKKPIKFIQKSKITFAVSILAVLLSVISIFIFKPNFGIDFTGGTLMEIQFEQEVDSNTLSEKIEQFDENLGTPRVVQAGDSQIIKVKELSEEKHTELLSVLEENFGALEEIRFNTIGPTIGDSLKQKALWALGFTLIAIVLYIAFAFRKIPRVYSPWRFSFCALVALFHDIFIIFGVFIALGHFMGVEIDSLFVTALLTILGFSVNDTIVVFDRIRENLSLRKKGQTLTEIANKSLSQTLARSLNTSLSTLFILVALISLGATSITFFVLALILGVIIGTYSSIFIASNLLVKWTNWSLKQ